MAKGRKKRRGRKAYTGAADTSRGRYGLRGSPARLAIVASAAALAIVVIVAIVLAAGGSGSEFTVYQGHERLGGSTASVDDLLDDGVPLVLNFWGGDCPPCRFEMPALQRVYETHRDNINFLGLDIGPFMGLGTRQSARDLLSELQITYPAGAPPDREVQNRYSVSALPTTVFFGADGQVFRRWDGAISEEQMNQIVDAMLNAS
jgi:thiol-disulfide isomerase/thioredoxin